MRGWHLTKGLLAPILAVLLLIAACGDDSPPVEPEPPTPAPTEATPSPQAATATPAPVRTPIPPTATIPVPSPTPTPEPEPYDGELVSMRLPSLDVEAPIEPIGLVEGRNKLDVPEPENVGWYDIYDKPGFGTSSLYSAHKDYWPNIRGPFYELTEIEYGAEIVLVMDDGREYIYEVFFKERYTVDTIPMYDLIWPHKARNPELQRPEDEEWIALYTCGGDFVETTEGGAGYYLHRDVVIARLVERVPPPSVQTVDQVQQ